MRPAHSGSGSRLLPVRSGLRKRRLGLSARKIKNGVATLGYQLHADALRSVVWGDGTNVSSVLPGVGTVSNQSLTVYGRLPSLTGAVPGT